METLYFELESGPEVLIYTSIAIFLYIVGYIIIKSDKAKKDGTYTQYGCLGMISLLLGFLCSIPFISLFFSVLSLISKLANIIFLSLAIVILVLLGINFIIKKIKGD